MYPRTVYYKYGFAKKDVLMCDDCHKIESEFHEFGLIAVPTESNAYETISQKIKEKTAESSSFLLHNNNNNNRPIDDKEAA